MKNLFIVFLCSMILVLSGCTNDDEGYLNKEPTLDEINDAIKIFCSSDRINNIADRILNSYSPYYRRYSFIVNNNIYSDKILEIKELDSELEICPEEFNREFHNYFENMKDSEIIINNNFMTLDGITYPITDVEMIGKIVEDVKLEIKSLNKVYTKYELRIRTITGYNSILYFKNKEIAELQREKLINTKVLFSRTILQN